MLILAIAITAGYAGAQNPDPGPPSDNGVQPVVVPNNPSCASEFPGTYSIKLEDATDYTQEICFDGSQTGNGTLIITGPSDAGTCIDLTADGTYFSYDLSSACVDICGVIVKGGPDGNVYNYYSCDGNNSDGNLHAPINPGNNQPYGISHIEFCYKGSFNLMCPADADVECDESTEPANTGTAAVEAGCEIYVCEPVSYSYTDVTTNGSCANEYSITRTWTATDNCGNQKTCEQTINVDDTTPPSAPEAPADLNLKCASDVPTAGELTATDNCAGDITISPTDVIGAGHCVNDFVLVRTWTFNDGCGNSVSVSQTITVKDDEAPVPPAPPTDLNLECASDVPAPGDLTATDNCDGDITVSPTDAITAGNCVNDFVLVRTWTFVDLCGNSTSVHQTITVKDDEPPVAPEPPTDLNLECASDVPAPGDLTASDNCDGDITVSPTDVIGAGHCVNDFVLVRTWTFDDGCGNSVSVSQTITVKDDEAPVPPAPPTDLNLECASDVPGPGDLTASDNCDGDIAVSPTEESTPGNCPNDFVLVRTWTFVDYCGNSSSVSQTITVHDGTAPVPPAAPGDLNVKCSSDVPPPGALIAIDNCDGPVVGILSSEFTQGACFNDYEVVRTWTFVDICGNSSSVSQTITVFDDEAPVVPVPPADVTAQCAVDVPPMLPLTATDNCDGDITVLPIDQMVPGACANDFVIERTWTFEDECGNLSSVSQTITVKDDIAPVPSPAPPDLVLHCASELPDLSALSAFDNCDGLILSLPNLVTISGNCANDFTQIRTWTFEDGCGNTSSVSQTIIVKDDTPPLIFCPDNIIVDYNPNLPIPTPDVTGEATASDNCGVVTVSWEDTDISESGVCSYNFTITRTWTAIDECGNSISCEQFIEVVDKTPPIIDPQSAPSLVDIECGESVDPGPENTPHGTDESGGIVEMLKEDVMEPGDYCGATYSFKRIWRAKDACGNLSLPFIQTIKVVDLTPPTIECPADAVVECGLSTDPNALGIATASDICGDVTITWSDVFTPGCGNTGEIVRTWTATDECNNSISCDQTITIVDGTPPSIVCPPDVTLECGNPSGPGATGMATGSDICGIVDIAFTDNFTPGCGNTGTIVRTWTATDECNNAISCDQTITIRDLTPPNAACPPDVTVECGESTEPSATGSATGSDICGDVVITHTDAFEPGCGSTGVINRTWKVTDACGNITVCIQKITIVDTTPPVITCAADKTALCDLVNFDAPTYSDVCGDVTVTSSDEDARDECGNGTVTRTWTAVDACGNVSVCSQTITINDCGSMELTKLTYGVPDATKQWSFSLFEGPDGYGGSLIESANTFGVGDGVLFVNLGHLSANGTYTICENGVPAGWATTWEIDVDGDGVVDITVPPYNPNSDDPVPADLGNRCFDFGAGTSYPLPLGATSITCKLVFQVNNFFPGGDPRTPGYWKNWNNCTNGNQPQTAANNGGPDEGWYILDDILNDPGITLGSFVVEDCEGGVRILDQRDLCNGKKKASDAAYTLAMHLLAAKLNFAAGAQTCQGAMDAVVAGDQLLLEIGYDACGNYLRPNNELYDDALCIAAILDSYNNGNLCLDGVYDCEYSPPQPYTEAVNSLNPLAEDVSLTGLDEREIVVYPNPSMGDVTFLFKLNEDSPSVTLEVYSITGQLADRIYEGSAAKGTSNTVTLKRGTLPPGTYLWRLTSGQRVQSGKFVLTN